MWIQVSRMVNENYFAFGVVGSIKLLIRPHARQSRTLIHAAWKGYDIHMEPVENPVSRSFQKLILKEP